MKIDKDVIAKLEQIVEAIEKITGNPCYISTGEILAPNYTIKPTEMLIWMDFEK